MTDKADFEISFNPDTSQGVMGDADGGPETALVFHNMLCAKDGHTWTGDQFYLLKGDFRADYQAIIDGGGGKWRCKQFYDKQKKRYGSRWSSDFHDWGQDGRIRLRGPRRAKAGAA